MPPHSPYMDQPGLVQQSPMVERGQWATAALNAIGSVLAGLAAAGLGLAVGAAVGS